MKSLPETPHSGSGVPVAMAIFGKTELHVLQTQVGVMYGNSVIVQAMLSFDSTKGTCIYVHAFGRVTQSMVCNGQYVVLFLL